MTKSENEKRLKALGKFCSKDLELQPAFYGIQKRFLSQSLVRVEATNAHVAAWFDEPRHELSVEGNRKLNDWLQNNPQDLDPLPDIERCIPEGFPDVTIELNLSHKRVLANSDNIRYVILTKQKIWLVEALPGLGREVNLIEQLDNCPGVDWDAVLKLEQLLLFGKTVELGLYRHCRSHRVTGDNGLEGLISSLYQDQIQQWCAQIPQA